MMKKAIQEITSSNTILVFPDALVFEVISIMKTNAISAVVIVEDKKAVGIFTERDIVKGVNTGGIRNVAIKELMSAPVITAKNTISIYEAYNILDTNSIRHLIVEGAHGELVGIVTQTDIINSLGFEYFVDLKNASEIMTKGVRTLKQGCFVRDAVAVMAEHMISCVIVEDEGRATGILTERDIAGLLIEDKDINSLTLGSIMRCPVYTISLDTPIFDATMIMKRNKIRRLVVVDKNNCIAGLITQSDIIKRLKGRYTEFLKEVIREQDKEYRDLVNNALVGVYRSTIEGRLIFANKAFSDIFGFASPEEMMSYGTLARYKDPQDRELLIGKLKKTGKVDSMELELLTKTGEVRNILLSGLLDGDVITGVVVDITSRKRYEQELFERNIELTMLYKVSSAIANAIDLDKLFVNILETISCFETLNIKANGGIFILEGEGLRLVHQLRYSKEFLRAHEDLKIGQCLCGAAAKTGEVIVSKRSAEDPRHTVQYSGMVSHGHIIIPLKAKDRVTGVLYLDMPADFDIDESILNTLKSIGNQIGLAIENSMLYEETISLSLHDHLTGLANRRYMDIVFDRALAEVRRFKHPLSVIMADIDNFKKYNDMHGHSAGDRCLTEVARLILESTRNTDLAARYGGEEFFIILPDTDITEACEVAERVRCSVEKDGITTISLGVAVYNDRMHGWENLIKEDLINLADKALYQAKKNGRNRFEAI